MLRRLPFFKLLAIGQVVLLARNHVNRLTPAERAELAALLRRGWKLDASERRELREVLRKLEPRAFAVGAADRFSPIPLPKRLMGPARRRGR
ncbi:MAG: hypothetical protein QOC68_3583 [Solirubrobacteraceae bacterium]|jgi:hypothetical protein|nr:hypothetical protein [Solirubrobacteraceae bacterium]